VIFRSTDIETIPDLDAWKRGYPTYKLVGGRIHSPHLFEPLVEEVDVIPPPYACRVVAISYVDIRFDAGSEPKYRYEKCWSECLWDASGSRARADALEHKLLNTFNEAMSAEEFINLVTWNGRTFDLPVIMMRSLKHRLACRWYYANKDMRYRFSAEGHCDLMDFLADYGACRFMKLGDIARLIGLPGKTDMSGDKVGTLYEASCKDVTLAETYQAKTARYCLQDSIQTALVWLRSRHLLGKVVPETHNAGLATFRESPSITGAIDLDWNALML
jgi:hypothetical protein